MLDIIRYWYWTLLFFLLVSQSVTAILDAASNDLLSECHRRSLKKIASLPDSNEEIDDTILTWWDTTETRLFAQTRPPQRQSRETRQTCYTNEFRPPDTLNTYAHFAIIGPRKSWIEYGLTFLHFPHPIYFLPFLKKIVLVTFEFTFITFILSHSVQVILRI